MRTIFGSAVMEGFAPSAYADAESRLFVEQWEGMGGEGDGEE